MKVTEKELYNYLIKKGLSRNHAIGMINNIKSESSFNVGVLGDYMIADPTKKLSNAEKLVFQGKDKSWYYTKYHPTKARKKVPSDLWDGIKAKSGGLFQHYGSRFEAMKKSAGSDWKTDWKGQIDYALKENDTKKYLAQNFPNEQEASTWFTVNWERPQNAIDTARTRLENIPTVIKNIDSPEEVKDEEATDDDVIVDGGELPEVTVEEQGTTVDAGELPEVTVEEEGKTYDAGKLPEIKIEDKKDADVIKSLPPENLSVDKEGQLYIVEQEGNNTVAKAAIKGSVPGETQYVQVMGPNDQIITIPIGENVTQEDIKRSFKLQETGEIEYTNFDEVYKNIDNIDKSRPIKIQENRYKWDKDKNEFRVINDDGTFKLGKEGQINPNFVPNTFQKEAKKRQEKIKEERAKEMMIDQDGDGIPDTIDIDGGTGTDESLVTPESVDTTEQTDENVTNVPSTPLEGLAGLGSSLIKGAGKVLDYVGGPGGIISYVLGKKGLAEAMKEVKPQASAKLSPMFMQHLRQTKELAKRGFHPEQARKIQKGIDNAYQRGLENAVRGTAGDRAKYLAQSGILDAKRSSALLDFAAKDSELQKANEDKYQKLMMFKENFDIQQTEKERTEDMKRQQANKDAAVKFTGAAFANVLSGLGGSSLSNTTPASGSPFYNYIDNVGNQSVSLKDLQELINKEKGQ